MPDDCLAVVLACRDAFVAAAAERLLAQSISPARSLTPSRLPAEAGVYIFYHNGEERPFHVGESVNLRQRIYQNQLRGQSGQSPLYRKLAKLPSFAGPELRTYMLDHMSVRWLPLALGRIEVEDYLNARFGIVESRPNAPAAP
jgi:hypothetical protein